MDDHIVDNINIYYKRIFHSLKKLSGSTLEQLNLTKVDANIIMTLDRENEQSKSQLAKYLSFQPSALTRSLDRLVNLNYVKRITDNKDKRFIKLSLTAKGKQLANRYTQAMRHFWIKGLNGIKSNEIQKFEKTLHKIYLNLYD